MVKILFILNSKNAPSNLFVRIINWIRLQFAESQKVNFLNSNTILIPPLFKSLAYMHFKCVLAGNASYMLIQHFSILFLIKYTM